MSEPFSIRKAFDFSPLAVGKSTSSTIKGILVLLAIAGISYAVYKAYIKKPEPTTTQNANRIDNYNFTLTPHQTFFGCANYHIIHPKDKKESIK